MNCPYCGELLTCPNCPSPQTCDLCDGTGQFIITHDMAIDAGNKNLSGAIEPCGKCGGTGVIE